MKALYGCAAVLLMLTGAAHAQTTVIERSSPSVITREQVELTPAQRTTIYRTVTRERRVVPDGVDVRLGARVPQAVELYEIPAPVVTEIPSIRRYRYMVVNNEGVLVDPTTSQVVEIIRQ